MRSSRKIIPIFLPYAGCKHRCVFCDQFGATGVRKRPSPSDISSTIEEYLKTGDDYELAFYGGTFTGLPLKVQREYLEEVSRWIGKGVSSIRISTRPDEMNEDVAKLLKEFNVEFVEIGAQSMFDEVLKASKRGHTVEDTLRAIEILKKYGMKVGIHLMVGLPKSDRRKDVESAEIVSELGVDTARVHPTLVFRGTELERMMERGEYEPLDVEEAVDRTAEMVIVLESKGVRVIRIGLHVPTHLVGNISAGPYHPSFGGVVRSRIVLKIVEELGIKVVEYDSRHESWIFGYGNSKALKEMGVSLIKSDRLSFDGMSYEEALRRYSR